MHEIWTVVTDAAVTGMPTEYKPTIYQLRKHFFHKIQKDRGLGLGGASTFRSVDEQVHEMNRVEGRLLSYFYE